jgi:uncharacterized protein YjhX (UPF0386 family)
MDAATQCGKILAYCDEHGSITAREAFIHLGINSPRKAISVLRKTHNVKAVEMDNNGKKPYHRYYISKKECDSNDPCI